jgi:hypothetical protein
LSCSCRAKIPSRDAFACFTPSIFSRESPGRVATGDVRGVDIATVGFDEDQLAITADVVVPGLAERILQLISDEPSHELVGGYTATSANVRTTKARSMAYLPFISLGGWVVGFESHSTPGI